MTEQATGGAPDDTADEEEGLAELVKQAEKRKERKKQEDAPKPALDTRGYVKVGTKNVRVHGSDAFVNAGNLWVRINGVDYRVTVGTNLVGVNWGKISYPGGVAWIGGTALSLEAAWPFAWNVPIGDVEKYFAAAWAAYSQVSDLQMPGMDTQYYGNLTGTVNGYNAHVSLSRADVRGELKKRMARGADVPGNGWLTGLAFHVTVEAYGRDNADNPRAWTAGGSWTGKTERIGTTTASSVYQMGLDWIRLHR